MVLFIGVNIFGLISIICIIVFRHSLPYYYASDKICEYKIQAGCVSVYNDIFNGTNFGMFLIAFLTYIDGIFTYLQATLYACLDFKFIQVSTIICFFCIYLPCVGIAYFVLKSEIAILISYNIPIIILVIIYLFRLLYITNDLDKWVTTKLGITENDLKLRRSMMLSDPNLLVYNNDDELSYHFIKKTFHKKSINSSILRRLTNNSHSIN